ncbi:MAG: DedA family protein [Acidimicrobiia bacterium]|jgi:membrane protein DedA with SNARE-associated domain
MGDAGIETSRPSSRASLTLLVVPMVAVTAVAQVGDALAPTLLVEHPLLLVAMIPRTRYLVLTAPLVDVVPFFVVGLVRLVLTDPVFFAFGRRYGDVGIRWIERKSGSPRTVQTAERWFRKASHPIVAVAPNNLVCVLAGATGMRTAPFLVLNLGGTAARMALVVWVGDLFSDQLLDVTDFVGRYRWWLTGISVSLVTISVWRARHTGRSEIETVGEVEAELTEMAEDQPPGGATRR